MDPVHRLIFLCLAVSEAFVRVFKALGIDIQHFCKKNGENRSAIRRNHNRGNEIMGEIFWC